MCWRRQFKLRLPNFQNLPAVCLHSMHRAMAYSKMCPSTTTSHGTSRFVSERRFGMGCPSHLQVCLKMAGATHAETSFWHKPAGAVRSCCNNEFPARSIAEMCPSVLNFLVAKGNVAQYFLVAKGNVAHGANSTYQTSLWCLRNRKRHAVAEQFAQLQFWFRAILFCEENERDKHHYYQGFKNSEFTYQILFSFSQKDRRTDSWNRQKTQRSPVSSSIFVGESEENLFRNEPDKSAFQFRFDHLEKNINSIHVQRLEEGTASYRFKLHQELIIKQSILNIFNVKWTGSLLLGCHGNTNSSPSETSSLTKSVLVLRERNWYYFQGCLILLHTNTPIECMIQ